MRERFAKFVHKLLFSKKAQTAYNDRVLATKARQDDVLDKRITTVLRGKRREDAFRKALMLPRSDEGTSNPVMKDMLRQAMDARDTGKPFSQEDFFAEIRENRNST